MVGRVRASAEQHARQALEALARELGDLGAIALRVCPKLPATVAERLTDYHAQNNADWVMYREALAGAATERGWQVMWFDARRVFDEAASALARGSLDELLARTGAALGPPWQKDHKLAMAAAIAAQQRLRGA